MAGRGPRPKSADTRRRTSKPALGEWKPAPGIGWQHGKVPDPPDGLLTVSRDAWTTWMQAWFAAHWSTHDLPMLRQIIGLFDKVERNQANSAEITQYRQLLDSYGITPKGQQDRRWTPPESETPPATGATPAAKPTSRYGHLSVAK